jgi:hypothetical protein
MNGFIDNSYTPLGNTNNYCAIANLHNWQITTAPAKPFPACFVFTRHFLVTGFNSGDSSVSRTRVLCSHTRIENSPTVTSLFSHPWRAQLFAKSKSKLYYDRRSAGKSVLEQSTHLGFTTRSWLLSDICGFLDLGRPLWREDESVFYSCCWPSPAQSFSGPSPVGLVAIFYCLRFEASFFVASYDSQGHGGGIRPRHHTGTTRCFKLSCS